MKKILGITSLVFLAACGSGPSEADMNAAMKKETEAFNKQMTAIGSAGGTVGTTITDAYKIDAPNIKKIGCKQDGENAFLCDVEVITKEGAKATPARFVKGSDGWMMTK